MINPFKKYPYIVVEGPIGSGKSTLSRILGSISSNGIITKALSSILGCGIVKYLVKIIS